MQLRQPYLWVKVTINYTCTNFVIVLISCYVLGTLQSSRAQRRMKKNLQ